MKFLKGKIGLISLIAVLAVVSAVTVIWAIDAGTDGDPLVSVSYIDKKVIPAIKEYVDSKLTSNPSSEIMTSTSGNPQVFTVVSVSAGNKIIGEAGCELILRMGNAVVIANEKGGLADTTTGTDLANGASCPANHLLIVPVSDGRGLSVSTDALIMVKGKFSVQP